jgi:hypothetical protein
MIPPWNPAHRKVRDERCTRLRARKKVLRIPKEDLQRVWVLRKGKPHRNVARFWFTGSRL